MDIQLTPEQMAWLDGLVASRRFTSIEEAVRQLLDELMSKAGSGEDDLDWAKPLVDKALESVANGHIVTLEEHRAHTIALLARLGR